MLQTLRSCLRRSQAAVVSRSLSSLQSSSPNNIRPMFTRVNTLSLIHRESAKRREGGPKDLRLRAVHYRAFAAVHLPSAALTIHVTEEEVISDFLTKEAAAILPSRGHKANSIFTTPSPCKQAHDWPSSTQAIHALSRPLPLVIPRITTEDFIFAVWKILVLPSTCCVGNLSST